MPEISRFYGIIIRMFVEQGGVHNLPHFHAYYQENVAIYAIDKIELISGSLPLRQQRFVEAWAELHQEELKKVWSSLQSGNIPNKIKPLE